MATGDALVVVLVTAPVEAAPELATALLQRRLIACANVVGPLTSHYWWKGELQCDAESLLVLKTRQSRFDELASAVRELHPYDVPEVIALDVGRALPDYASWVRGEVPESA